MKRNLTFIMAILATAQFSHALGLSLKRVTSPSAAVKGPFRVSKLKCTDPKPEKAAPAPGADVEDQKIEANPKGIVDDAEIADCHSFEVDVAIDADISSQGKSYDIPVIELTYGLAPDIEISASMSRSQISSSSIDEDGNSSTQRASGAGRASVGAKVRVYNNPDIGLQIAVAPSLEFNVSSKSVEKGLTESGTVLSIPLIVQQRLGSNVYGDIVADASFGFNKVSGSTSPNSVSGGLAIGVPVSRNDAIKAGVTAERGTRVDEEGVRPLNVKVIFGGTHQFANGSSGSLYVGRSIRDSSGVVHKYIMANFHTEFGK